MYNPIDRRGFLKTLGGVAAAVVGGLAYIKPDQTQLIEQVDVHANIADGFSHPFLCNVALSDDEIASLAEGVSSVLGRSASIVWEYFDGTWVELTVAE